MQDPVEQQPQINEGYGAANKYLEEVISGELTIEASEKKLPNGDQEEDEDLLKNLIENIRTNPALKNEHIRNAFKLREISEEEDLHDYKKLLHAMAALFYTNHRLNDVALLFYLWRRAAHQRQEASSKKAVQIDTELANAGYKDAESDEEEFPSEIVPAAQEQHMMIHIEGDDEDILADEDGDKARDTANLEFLEQLKQVGPSAKQILNYTYPPLLYQRGDDEDDYDEEEDGMPQIEQEDFDNDADIQELIDGSGVGFDNEELYEKKGKWSNEKKRLVEDIEGKYGQVDMMDDEFMELVKEEARKMNWK